MTSLKGTDLVPVYLDTVPPSIASMGVVLDSNDTCAITKGVTATDWKSYQMQQPRGALPVGPMLVMVHIASVWVPFTSESKEAIAHYPEIIKELKLGLQECGRRVATHIRKRKREADEAKKRAYIEKYIPQVAIGLQEILGFNDKVRDKVVKDLEGILERSRRM